MWEQKNSLEHKKKWNFGESNRGEFPQAVSVVKSNPKVILEQKKDTVLKYDFGKSEHDSFE